jgi:hypothetical protein
VGGYARFATAAGVAATWSQWQGVAGEIGSTITSTTPQLDASIAAYLFHHGVKGGLPEFLALARSNSKQDWDRRWTSDAVNAWVRGVFGVPSR